jgi:hypothetical protein
MRQKIKNIQHNLKNNPEFQAKLQEMKPKKTIWGVLGVVLLFFVPEVINFFYYQEINQWVAESAYLYYPAEVADKVVWITKKMFDGALSFINIGLGFLFLWWLYR